MDEPGQRSVERLSSRDVEYLVSRLRERIYAYCDVEGFKARLVSALLGPPPPEMAGRNPLDLDGAGNPSGPALSERYPASIGLTQEKIGRFGLTHREAEILRLVARGHTNKEIAATLYVSPLTIRTHLEHVYEKLGVGNRTEAVARVLGTSGPTTGKSR
jgi:DNA-binding CsgD family transcriptional regulator